jgi:hypothetical protein
VVENGGNVAFKLGASGKPTVTKKLALTTSTTDVLELGHNSTGTPAGGFGSRTLWKLQSDTTAGREAFDTTTTWATATDASRKARTVFNAWDTAARECIRIEAGGTAGLVGFLGAAAVARQANTTDLKDVLVNFGFLTDGGATPLNTDGGALTAAGTNSLGATTLTGNLTLSTHDLVTDTTTGTKLATATGQKLALWNQTPIIQPTALTAADNTAIDATWDATEQAVLNNVRTRLNELETRLTAFGFLP